MGHTHRSLQDNLKSTVCSMFTVPNMFGAWQRLWEQLDTGISYGHNILINFAVHILSIVTNHQEFDSFLFHAYLNFPCQISIKKVHCHTKVEKARNKLTLLLVKTYFPLFHPCKFWFLLFSPLHMDQKVDQKDCFKFTMPFDISKTSMISQ